MRAKKPVFIGLYACCRRIEIRGAVVAIDCVGQRDTRWLIPLTVSGGYQGEEGNRTFQRRYRYPTTVAPFIFYDRPNYQYVRIVRPRVRYLFSAGHCLIDHFSIEDGQLNSGLVNPHGVNFENILRETTMSASIPGAMRPLIFSSKVEYAPARVYAFKASPMLRR